MIRWSRDQGRRRGRTCSESSILRTALLDALLCAAVVSVPSLSHAAAFPFYYLDPMRLLVFAAILFSTRRNALIMALGLPLLSMATSGHPVFPKVLLIQAELAVNVLLLALCSAVPTASF